MYHGNTEERKQNRQSAIFAAFHSKSQHLNLKWTAPSGLSFVILDSNLSEFISHFSHFASFSSYFLLLYGIFGSEAQTLHLQGPTCC